MVSILLVWLAKSAPNFQWSYFSIELLEVGIRKAYLYSMYILKHTKMVWEGRGEEGMTCDASDAPNSDIWMLLYILFGPDNYTKLGKSAFLIRKAKKTKFY